MPASGTATLRVGGLTPLTTIDYPGELAAVVFCQGCPWRCRYCQNPELTANHPEPAHAWATIIEFLQRRVGLLDAVVFSGGEPTAQRVLADAMSQVRALGFHVGLHTAGSYPERLGRLLPLLDWVGLDIKALPDDYGALTDVAGSGQQAWESLRQLVRHNVPFDVRITRHPDLLTDRQLDKLLCRLRAEGIDRPRIQACRTTRMLDPTLTRCVA